MRVALRRRIYPLVSTTLRLTLATHCSLLPLLFGQGRTLRGRSDQYVPSEAPRYSRKDSPSVIKRKLARAASKVISQQQVRSPIATTQQQPGAAAPAAVAAADKPTASGLQPPARKRGRPTLTSKMVESGRKQARTLLHFFAVRKSSSVVTGGDDDADTVLDVSHRACCAPAKPRKVRVGMSLFIDIRRIASLHR